MSSKDISARRAWGTLFVVSAPSGAGKTSLCLEIVAKMPDVRYSVSYTTRRPRPGEVDSRHYHFVDQATFRGMIQEDAFLEWAEVYGNFYGTPRVFIQECLKQGGDVVLDIDVQGARKIRHEEPEAVSIYILPPSLAVLRRRLEDRKGDAPEEIARRLSQAHDELKWYHEFRHVIINDDFQSSVRQFEAIVLAERTKTAVLELSGMDSAVLY